MRGAGHTSHSTDTAQRDRWMAEIAARPELEPAQLLGLFSPELINRIDKAQRERASKSVQELIGLTALVNATKDEQRLFNIAASNMADYEEGEDIIYEDPILLQLIDPEVRNSYSGSEDYTRANRLRRTVVAYYLINMQYDHSQDDPPETGRLPA